MIFQFTTFCKKMRGSILFSGNLPKSQWCWRKLHVFFITWLQLKWILEGIHVPGSINSLYWAWSSELEWQESVSCGFSYHKPPTKKCLMFPSPYGKPHGSLESHLPIAQPAWPWSTWPPKLAPFSWVVQWRACEQKDLPTAGIPKISPVFRSWSYIFPTPHQFLVSML